MIGGMSPEERTGRCSTGPHCTAGNPATMKRTLPVLVLGLSLAMTASRASAQGATHLTFKAPIVTGTSAAGPTRLQPLPGISVTAVFTHDVTGAPYLTSAPVDPQGRLAIPAGHSPVTAWISGPQSAQFIVERPISIASITQWLSETVVADYSTRGTSVDITTLPGTLDPGLGITVSECNAYFHVLAANRLLAPYSNAVLRPPLEIKFQNHVPVPVTPASYSASPDRINLYPTPGSGSYSNPDDVVVARSASVLAHEYAHRVIEASYGSHALLPRINEGLADFLASLVTGSPRIGEGVHGPAAVIRNIDSNAQYASFSGRAHEDGLVIAGALYHARQAFAAQGMEASFDAMIGPLLASHPFDEPEILCRLLAMTMSGTHRAMLRQAFTTRHGIVEPPPTACGQPGVTSINAGWGGASRPTLTGAIASGSTSLTVSLQGALPGATAWVFVSYPPAGSLNVGPGTIAIDFASLLLTAPVPTDASGAFSATLPTVPFLPPLAIQAATADGNAPFGVAASNGLRVVF